MPKVIHFEISAEKPEQAIRFYEKVFGWKVMSWEGPVEYWLFSTGEEGEAGIDGGLSRRQKDEDAVAVNTIGVPSVDEFAERVKRNGGTIVMPKHAVPGIGWLVYFKDTEGNMFGMMESDESAK